MLGSSSGRRRAQPLQADVDMKAFTKGLGVKPLEAPLELQNYFLGGAGF